MTIPDPVALPDPIQILLFSDTHLGFDLPIRPRVERRRRGEDFFANYRMLLNLARDKEVDLIVHGGDVFFRSRVPPSIVDMALEPMLAVADAGIPIYLVPGNHERSRLPAHLWWSHPNIRIFDQPRTYVQDVSGVSIALSGFPFARRVKDHFRDLLHETGYQEHRADVHYLCLHQAFEGAQVGPSDFTFRSGPDNIPPEAVPTRFTAVLSGHIHRAQQLTASLAGQPLSVPVIYPGSIERTAFAERFEEKYFVIIKLDHGSEGMRQAIEYHRLPSRPMVIIEIPTQDKTLAQVQALIETRLSAIDPHAVARVHLAGSEAEQLKGSITATSLRSLAPKSMNISLRGEERYSRTRHTA
jgi:DNA repair exonuclease SbcCD nuclease subunit